MRAGVYVRVSIDRDGQSESPARQLADCREVAQRKGVEVVDVYEDRDTSAFSASTRRPEYERLVADARAGRLDTIIFWKLDRITRQGLRGLVGLLDLGVKLISATEDIDTTTAMGEGVAGILASVAKQESQNTSLRVTRARRAAAEAGKMSTGGPRPYGFRRDGTVVEAEAAIVREVARRVLDGESFRQIAADLNTREVPTSTGAQWHSSVLASMVRSPLRAGFQVYRGEVIGEAPERAILTPSQHQALVAAKHEPRAYRKPHHLLAGITYCGSCGGKMKTMGFRMKNGQPFPRYQCVRTPGTANCGKVAATKVGLDAHVRDVLFGALAAGHLPPDRRSPDLDAATLRRLLVEDEARLAELSRARFVDDQITEAEWKAARAPLAERMDRTTAALASLADEQARVDATRGLRPGSRDELEAWWESADDHERRDAVHAAVARVEVRPAARRGGNVFDTSRVSVYLDWSVLEKVAARGDPNAPAPQPDPADLLALDAQHAAEKIIQANPDLEPRRDEIERQIIEDGAA